jgi:hypothetical protein
VPGADGDEQTLRIDRSSVDQPFAAAYPGLLTLGIDDRLQAAGV